MSASFEKYDFRLLLDDEGHGYSDHPNDPGGPTNRGISLRFLRDEGIDIDGDDDVDADDVRAITDEIAKKIALERFWNRYRCNEFNDQRIANKFFNHVFNTPLLAITALQRACASCDIRGLPVDGKMGPATVAYVNACSPVALLAAFRSEMAGAYRVLAARRPASMEFLNGWLARAYR